MKKEFIIKHIESPITKMNPVQKVVDRMLNAMKENAALLEVSPGIFKKGYIGKLGDYVTFTEVK